MLITKGLALTAFRVLDDDDFWQKVCLFSDASTFFCRNLLKGFASVTPCVSVVC